MSWLPVGLLALSTLISMMQEKSQMSTAGSDRVLAKQKLQSGPLRGTFTLYERELPMPTTAARLRYSLHTKPAAGADSNLVFYLVVASERPADERIVWLTYATAPEFINPKPVFNAAIAPAVDRNSGTLWLVLADTVGTDTRFLIYRVDPATQVTTVPLRLDPERKEEWPNASQPNSELRYADATSSGCAISSMVFVPESKGTLIRAAREPKTCASLEAAYNASSGSWSKVVVQSDSSR